MTKEELFNIIEEHDGELVFEDGFALTDWSGGRFCMYTPKQGFGEGVVCGFSKALGFYNKHNNKEDNTMGGRGSGGAGAARGGAGGGAAKAAGGSSLQQANPAVRGVANDLKAEVEKQTKGYATLVPSYVNADGSIVTLQVVTASTGKSWGPNYTFTVNSNSLSGQVKPRIVSDGKVRKSAKSAVTASLG